MQSVVTEFRSHGTPYGDRHEHVRGSYRKDTRKILSADADHCCRMSVDTQRAADHLWVSGQAGAPESLANDNDQLRSGCFDGRLKEAPQLRRSTEG